MDAYNALIIPADPQFTPRPESIAAFFTLLEESWSFEINWNKKSTSALRIIKPNGKKRILGRNPETGQAIELPAFDRVGLDQISAIPYAIADLSDGSICASGSWRSSNLPFYRDLTHPLRTESKHWSSVCCNLRPHPVSMSTWRVDGGDGPSHAQFGEPADPSKTTGRFTHYSTGRTTELPNTASARFWVEFGLEEWLVPHVPKDFNLLNLSLVDAIQQHFGTRMVQAGRYIG